MDRVVQAVSLLVDRQGRVAAVCPQEATVGGLPAARVLGQPASRLFEPASGEKVAGLLAAPDGGLVPALLATSAEGGPAQSVWVRARPVLTSAPELPVVELLIGTGPREWLLERTPLGLWCADPTEGVNQRDDSAALLYGVPGARQLTVAEFLARVHPDDVPDLLSLQLDATEQPGRTVQAHFRFQGDDGGWRWLLTWACSFTVMGRPLLVGVSAALDGGPVDGRSDEGARIARRVRRPAEELLLAPSQERVADLLLERFPALIGATQATVGLLDGDRGRRLRIERRPEPPAGHGAPWVVPLDAALPLAVVARTGRPSFLTRDEYLALAPDGGTLVAEPRTRSWSILPLTEPGGAPLGAWALGHEGPDGLAPTAVAAIREVARLAGQALARTGRTQPYLDLADAFQAGAAPLPPDAVDGLTVTVRHLPAQHDLGLGGDWYDLIDLRDGTVMVCVGDVQGHGAHAAPLMARLRTLVRAYSLGSPDPGTVLGLVNDFLDRFPVSATATCTLLRLDPRTGSTLVARAAHPPLLVVGPDGAVRTENVTGGLPLGVLPGQGYPTEPVDLPPGALLALCTDGLVEGPALPLEQGLAALGAVLSAWPGDSLEPLADRLLPLAGATGHQDDATVLLLARQS
ncbi:PP2C family protein-serine/threonine phosphatase [Kitasatospora sp. NPDC004289]